MTLATALFGVTFQLFVTTTPPILVDNLTQQIDNSLADSLRVDWQVSKRLGPAPDDCRVRIYNLDPLLRTALKTARHPDQGWPRPSLSLLQLSVGWGGVPEPLFTAPLVDFVAERQEGADVVSEMVAGPGGWMRAVPSGMSEAGGQPVAVAAKLAIADAAGLRLGLLVGPAVFAKIEERAAATPLAAWARTDTRDPLDTIDTIMATIGLNWGIDGNQLVVYERGLRADLPLKVDLDPDSGLISWTAVRDGLEFEGLAQPRVVPGAQLELFRPGQFGLPVSIAGPLRCESVEFSGSNYGSSTMRGLARQLLPTAGGFGPDPNPLQA